jgi:hypothetical protein
MSGLLAQFQQVLDSEVERHSVFLGAPARVTENLRGPTYSGVSTFARLLTHLCDHLLTVHRIAGVTLALMCVLAFAAPQLQTILRARMLSEHLAWQHHLTPAAPLRPHRGFTHCTSLPPHVYGQRRHVTHPSSTRRPLPSCNGLQVVSVPITATLA